MATTYVNSRSRVRRLTRHALTLIELLVVAFIALLGGYEMVSRKATAGVTILCVIALFCAPAFGGGDLNNDGYPDIVFANYGIPGNFEPNSYIYWGAASNPWTTKTELATRGGNNSAIADLNADGYLDIIFSNNVAASGSRNLNSYIYWGAASNPWTTKTEIPTYAGVAASVADLNGDGHLDILFSNALDSASGTHNTNSYIHWGAASNPYSTRTGLATMGATGNSIADLNKDGYLDIVFANNFNQSLGSGTQTNSYIYWGAASNPYSAATRTNLSTIGAADVSVADLNSDSYLDIVFTNGYADGSGHQNAYIYWGAQSNPYSTKTDLPINQGTGNVIADLNADGYQDIIISNFMDSSSLQTDSYIYWGAQNNPYSTRTNLPTNGAIGVRVADLNVDGHLDILFSNYEVSSSPHTISPTSYIYWGADSDPYSTATRTELATLGSKSVSVSGSNIFGADANYGIVLPLWVTQGNYDLAVLTSAEYQYLASKNELLNNGALDLSDEEIARLTVLWMEGNDGLDPSPIVVDDNTWYYYSATQAGHPTPDNWYDQSTSDYYFQFGSGIATAPEPSTLLSILLGAFMLAGGRVFKRTK